MLQAETTSRPTRNLNSNRYVSYNDSSEVEDILPLVEKHREQGMSALASKEVEAVLNYCATNLGKQENFSDYLPFLFRINNELNFCLDNYKPFKALYNYKLPTKTLLKTGRQCSKSTNLAYKKVAQSAMTPNYRVLVVMPLFEQTKRFSSNYVKPAIDFSLIKNNIISIDAAQNVLEKNFTNGSRMTFTYASLSCDRARGIPADELVIDEIQDMNIDFIPILRECLSASKWRIETYAGTPKTLDNTLEQYWQRSSQGVWVIRCSHCGKENISTTEYDLINMIQDDTIRCVSCKEKLDSNNQGRWVHKFPSRLSDFLGLHVPQPVLPMHYGNERAWKLFLDKYKTMPKRTVYNEMLGESCDVGSKLISIENLKKCAKLPYPNKAPIEEIVPKTNRHVIRALGIDWGGRGEKEDSFTAMTVVGLTHSGQLEVLYGLKISPQDDDKTEIAVAYDLYRRFGCSAVGHDYNGVGMSKDQRLVDAGFPGIMPWSLITGNATFFARGTRSPTKRIYVRLNRSAAIHLLAHEVSNGRISFPQYSDDKLEFPFHDLNSWYEDYLPQENGADLYRIMRSAAQPDDIGMAVIFGMMTCYRRTNNWPKFTASLTKQGVIDGIHDED